MKNDKKYVNKSSQNSHKPQERVKFTVNMSEGRERIDTDPYGSYTGVPNDPYEEPVQDVDDL